VRAEIRVAICLCKDLILLKPSFQVSIGGKIKSCLRRFYAVKWMISLVYSFLLLRKNQMTEPILDFRFWILDWEWASWTQELVFLRFLPNLKSKIYNCYSPTSHLSHCQKNWDSNHVFQCRATGLSTNYFGDWETVNFVRVGKGKVHSYSVWEVGNLRDRFPDNFFPHSPTRNLHEALWGIG